MVQLHGGWRLHGQLALVSLAALFFVSAGAFLLVLVSLAVFFFVKSGGFGPRH